MPAALEESKNLVEQQAANALSHLSDRDKEKVLKYIESLLNLDKIKNDEASST
jgi:hypothetical protein